MSAPRESASLAMAGGIVARDVGKVHVTSRGVVDVLRDVSFDILAGEFVGVLGPSGAGKSSLLQLMGTLARPSLGTLVVDGIDVSSLSDRQLSEMRRERIGFVFQDAGLIDQLSVLENVAMPLAYAGKARPVREHRAREAIARVGLANLAEAFAGVLSGGEKQRAAMARALVADPPIILADEPTGSLDSKSSDIVMGLIAEARSSRRTIVMVTHNESYCSHFDRVLRVYDGQCHWA
jgi:putative ABC transport system ATP-binding protein